MLKRIIFLSLLTVGMVLAYQSVASAGGPWSDQYCNAQIETVIIKNTKGEIVDKKTVETMVCDDGAKDFLAYSGIANEWIRKKGYVCQKFDGSWEMVTPRQ